MNYSPFGFPSFKYSPRNDVIESNTCNQPKNTMGPQVHVYNNTDKTNKNKLVVYTSNDLLGTTLDHQNWWHQISPEI